MCHAILLGFGVQSFTVLWIHSGAEIDACVLFTEQGNTVAVQIYLSRSIRFSHSHSTLSCREFVMAAARCNPPTDRTAEHVLGRE